MYGSGYPYTTPQGTAALLIQAASPSLGDVTASPLPMGKLHEATGAKVTTSEIRLGQTHFISSVCEGKRI